MKGWRSRFGPGPRSAMSVVRDGKDCRDGVRLFVGVEAKLFR